MTEFLTLSTLFRLLKDLQKLNTEGTLFSAVCPACQDADDLLDIGIFGDGANATADIQCTTGCTLDEISAALNLHGYTLVDIRADVRDVPSDTIRAGLVEWARVAKAEDVDRARAVLQHIRGTGRDVAYTHESGYLIWEGAEWRQSSETEVRRFIHEAGDLMADAAVVMMSDARKLDDEERAEVAIKAAASTMTGAKRLRRTNLINALLVELRSLPGVLVSLNEFDTDLDILGVDNGVVELRSGDLRAYRKEDRITRVVHLDYRADAVNPRWDKFLGEIFVDAHGAPDVEMVGYIQRLIGYGVTGHTTEQLFAVLYGGGSNGKGVFTETLKAVLGDHVTATPFDTFEQKPTGGISNDIAALRGSRIVLASEGEAGRPMAESLIKRLTGGDTISARFMRKNYFEFKPSFLILLSTNHKPTFRGQDAGLWRRVKLLPFIRSFEGSPDKDPDLENKLKGAVVAASAWRDADDFGDGPAGILAWAVRGAVEWYAGSLREPASVKAETAAFREESDRLGEFIACNFAMTGEHLDVVKEADVWRRYTAWTHEQEEEPIRKHNFLHMLRNRSGFTAGVRDKSRVLRGAKLLTPQEQHAQEQQAIRDERHAAGLRLVADGVAF